MASAAPTAADAAHEPIPATVPQRSGPLQGRPQAPVPSPKPRQFQTAVVGPDFCPSPGPTVLVRQSQSPGSAVVGHEAGKQRPCVAPRALIEEGIAVR